MVNKGELLFQRDSLLWQSRTAISTAQRRVLQVDLLVVQIGKEIHELVLAAGEILVKSFDWW